MKISKIALRLSIIDALLVLLASASGILLKSIYARETLSWALQGIAQESVNALPRAPHGRSHASSHAPPVTMRRRAA
jgi:hypothetical protein